MPETSVMNLVYRKYVLTLNRVYYRLNGLPLFHALPAPPSIENPPRA